MVLYAVQGSVVLSSYVNEILTNSNSNISPIDASIGITTMSIGANLISVNLIDRVGRRTIYMFSSMAATLGLFTFAAYLHCLIDNHAFDWVPIVCISFVLFVACLGMNSVPFIFTYEILPEKVWKIFSFFNESVDIDVMVIRWFSDKELLHLMLQYIDATSLVNFNSTFSPGERAYRTGWMDNIFCRDEFVQRTIRHICFARDKR